MAEATVVEEALVPEKQKFFCHQCSQSIEITIESVAQELSCPQCESGCIEELTPELEEISRRRNRRGTHSDSLFGRRNSGGLFDSSSRRTSQARMHDLVSLFPSVFSGYEPGERGEGRGSRGEINLLTDHDVDHVTDDDDDDDDDSDGDVTGGTAGLLFGPRRYFDDAGRPSAFSNSDTALPRFLEHLLGSLSSEDGEGGGAVGGLSFPFGGPQFLNADPRDYAWGSDGLDNVITQLLNQLEGSGPAPATEDIINNLKLIHIDKYHISCGMNCSVCMEQFSLEDDTVNSLPCDHIFHNTCIVPWLKIHGTCPICRLSLVTDENKSSKSDTSAQPGLSLVSSLTNHRPPSPRPPPIPLNLLVSSSSSSSSSSRSASIDNEVYNISSSNSPASNTQANGADEDVVGVLDYMRSKSTASGKRKEGGERRGGRRAGSDRDDNIFVSLSSSSSQEDIRPTSSILWRSGGIYEPISGSSNTGKSKQGKSRADTAQSNLQAATNLYVATNHSDQVKKNSNHHRKPGNKASTSRSSEPSGQASYMSPRQVQEPVSFGLSDNRKLNNRQDNDAAAAARADPVPWKRNNIPPRFLSSSSRGFRQNLTENNGDSRPNHSDRGGRERYSKDDKGKGIVGKNRAIWEQNASLEQLNGFERDYKNFPGVKGRNSATGTRNGAGPTRLWDNRPRSTYEPSTRRIHPFNLGDSTHPYSFGQPESTNHKSQSGTKRRKEQEIRSTKQASDSSDVDVEDGEVVILNGAMKKSEEQSTEEKDVDESCVVEDVNTKL